MYLESTLHNIKNHGAFQKINETCKCEHFIFCNACIVFYFYFSFRTKLKKKKNAKVFSLGKALNRGPYQNWAHSRRKHQAHALALPHMMSPYFGEANGLRPS